MTYYVTQYGDVFFELKRVKGYSKKYFFLGTKITAEEYKKLYYSGERKCLNFNCYDVIRIKGNASKILGREIDKVCLKMIKEETNETINKEGDI